MQKIRKITSHIVFKIFIAVAVLVFVLMGFSDYFINRYEPFIAKVGDKIRSTKFATSLMSIGENIGTSVMKFFKVCQVYNYIFIIFCIYSINMITPYCKCWICIKKIWWKK